MERRNARVFDVEATDLDESHDLSAPTVVVSAAPLQACVRTSAPTVRIVAAARPPGKPLGTQPPPRRAQQWSIEPPWETAPVKSIPMPGERASTAVTIVQRVHIAERPPMLVLRACESPAQAPGKRASTAVTIVQPVSRPLATRACEPPVQYSVEREVSAMAAPRRAMSRRGRRSGHLLVLIIGMLAGFMTVLTVVVVRQQRELEATAEPAHRANEACAAYGAEVRAIALELTQAAGDVAEVEERIGERARGVVNDRGLQRVCTGQTQAPCPHGDAACISSTVMQLRQGLPRR